MPQWLFILGAICYTFDKQGALAPVRKEVLDLIASLKNKMCVIFSSHILMDIEKVCDNILLINEGKIIVNDSCDNILKNGNYLMIKCNNREDAMKLKEIYEEMNFSTRYENTLEVQFDDLISWQLDILKNAKKLKINIEKLEVKKDTLEEVFLFEVSKHE